MLFDLRFHAGSFGFVQVVIADRDPGSSDGEVEGPDLLTVEICGEEVYIIFPTGGSAVFCFICENGK